jgi:hypothetical protein
MYRNDAPDGSSWHYRALQPSLADTADLAQSMDEQANCGKIDANDSAVGRVLEMAEYQGYEISKNPESEKWEVFWKGKKVRGEFLREADAEEWIDDQFPSHRF